MVIQLKCRLYDSLSTKSIKQLTFLKAGNHKFRFPISLRRK